MRSEYTTPPQLVVPSTASALHGIHAASVHAGSLHAGPRPRCERSSDIGSAYSVAPPHGQSTDELMTGIPAGKLTR